MPTTYTHDLFGKKVYRRLPEEMKEIIRKNGDLYRIGLHGPDIFFYFLVSRNPVTQFGVKMHKEKARAFFQEGMRQVRKEENPALTAYLLGFACHYILDSTCHPYVNQMAKKGVITHTLLEKEFDRTLMEKTGKDPYSYRPSDCIVPEYDYARVIHQAVPLVRTSNIFLSLKMMKASTNAMICNDGGRRRAVLSMLAGLAGEGSRQFILDHFMAERPLPHVREPQVRLEELFEEALLEAPGLLEELYSLAGEEKELSPRWNRTYNG